MTSAPLRDPLAGHLITPESAAFLFIDDQPLPEPAGLLSDGKQLDRTRVSSWEDIEFVQRDWARRETVPAIVEIVLTDRLKAGAVTTEKKW
jgi:hypothetical protein